MWIFSLYSMVDGVFVAWGVGDMALAAVNLSMPYVSLVFMVGILFATGTSTVISIALGQKDLPLARNFFNQNIVVVGGVSLVGTALTLLNLDRICLFLGATAPTMQYVREYVGTISVFFVFFVVSYNLEVQVKANGAPHISIIGVISCALMNVFLDWLFVMIFHWGVFGAALATGLAQMTSTTVFVIYFSTHKEKLRLEKFKWDLGAYKRIVPLGVSDGFNELSNGIVIFLFNNIILRLIGEAGVVTYTIISYVNTLVLMTMTGTAQGIQPLVSFHLGANERHICHKLLRYGVTAIAAFSAISFAIGRFGAGFIVGCFLPHGTAVFDYSVSSLQTYSLAFLVLGFNVIFAGYFTAVEKPVYSLSISFSRSLVLVVGSLIFLSTVFGAGGIWYATLLSETLCLCLTGVFVLLYVRGQRKSAVLERLQEPIPKAET
ncbi:MAG: MATE family efflux transporter [Clostridia bacterium]|nr:MATE family efflux transporter [Clostridia bacterium]